ncbi:MAG: DUF6473 family protein [Pseudomonadota bacterium]
MTYQKPDAAFINYHVYRWGRLNQIYRGPEPDLTQPYIACLGAAQTFGRYVRRPFPDLMAKALGHRVANFGTGGAGPGFFLRDSKVMEAANDAALCVVQVMSARSLSNRLFKVKVRRNAQVKAVSSALEDLFPTVKFDQFTYAHNMLNEMAQTDANRFAEVERELKTAWIARTRTLLESIEAPTILLWFSERAPESRKTHREGRAMLKYPHFVDRDMIEQVAHFADDYVECATDVGMPQSLLVDNAPVLKTPKGDPVTENRYYPSPEMHEAAAAALTPAARRLLDLGPRARAEDDVTV